MEADTRGPLWRWIGSPLGRHAAPGGLWRSPTPWALILATLTWMLTMWRNTPCIQTTPDSYPATFNMMCYTDIPVLYLNRGLTSGKIPIVDIPMEYPVLTTWLMEIARRAVNLLGGYSGPDPTAIQSVHGAATFYAVTAIMMFVCFLGLVVVHLRLHRPWDALLIAASPLVIAGGLINWDMLVVFLGAAAILAWSRRRPALAGVLIGLGIAAKLYPVFWLLPLFVLCLRSGKIKEFVTAGIGTVAAWLAVNLPMFLISPSNWLNFWTFNVDRGADLGSLWYVLQLANLDVPHVSKVVTVLMGLCGLALAALVLLAPRRPRLSQTLFLITVAFLVLNKVYSPQYMLWLLPLLVLARPKARELLFFTLAELGYWAAVWGHLGQTLNPGGGGPDKIYWLAVLLRIGVQVWLAILVIRDILEPEHDPIRNQDWAVDDPDGGIFDHALDMPWVHALQRRFGSDAWPEPLGEPAHVGPLYESADESATPPEHDDQGPDTDVYAVQYFRDHTTAATDVEPEPSAKTDPDLSRPEPPRTDPEADAPSDTSDGVDPEARP